VRTVEPTSQMTRVYLGISPQLVNSPTNNRRPGNKMGDEGGGVGRYNLRASGLTHHVSLSPSSPRLLNECFT
jgi:hypothetical protein